MKRAAASPGSVLWLLLVGAAAAGGCHRRPARGDDCRLILDRLVDLELQHSGYHDPSLAARWREELAHRFEADLQGCTELRVRTDLATCIAAAQTSDAVVHCVK
jgi:hypothetical protein